MMQPAEKVEVVKQGYWCKEGGLPCVWWGENGNQVHDDAEK